MLARRRCADGGGGAAGRLTARPMNLLGRPVGLDQPLFLIAGPCVVESEELQLRTAERLKAITERLGMHFIFKSSFDKANRSSDRSYRGPGHGRGPAHTRKGSRARLACRC